MMAWRRPGDKPLSEPMMVNLTTHICVSRLQLIKASPCPLQSLVVSWLWVQAVDLTIDWPMKIDHSHKPTLHLTNIPQCTILYVTKMCTHVHISVTTWCIVGYGTGALQDCKFWSISMCSYSPAHDDIAVILLPYHPASSTSCPIC